MLLFLLAQADSLDRQRLKEDVNRVENFLNLESEELRLNRDWAVWDDSYALIRGESKDYISKNLMNDTFINNQLNIMVCLDNYNKAVFQKEFELKEERTKSINPQFLDELLSTALQSKIRHIF